MTIREVIHQPFDLAGDGGHPLRGDLRYPSEEGRWPVIVLCHGFRGSKDHSFLPYLALKLARRGFVVATFNFSGSGIGADLQHYTELDRLERATIAQDLADIRRVVDGLAEGKLLDRDKLDFDRLALAGHAKGGALAIIAGNEDPRVKVVATLAAVDTLDPFTHEDKVHWRQKGYLPFLDAGLAREIRLDLAILDDLERSAERYDLARALRTLRKPLILIHGEEDHSSDASASERLYHLSDKDRTRLVILEKTGHLFGTTHPFEESNKELEKIIQILSAFFTQSFAGVLPRDI